MRAPAIAVLLSLASVASARAGDAGTEAMERYQRGMKHYNLGEWWAALDDFKQAYLVKADPALLFDIAQCQRQLGQYDAAARSYRAFLREAPDAPDEQRAQVRLLIAQMEQAMRSERAPAPPTGTAPPESEKPGVPTASLTGAAPPSPIASERPTTPGPTRALVVHATPTAPRARAPLYKRWWLWTSAAAVVVVAASVGAGLGATRSGAPTRAAMTDFGTIHF